MTSVPAGRAVVHASFISRETIKYVDKTSGEPKAFEKVNLFVELVGKVSMPADKFPKDLKDGDELELEIGFDTGKWKALQPVLHAVYTV